MLGLGSALGLILLTPLSLTQSSDRRPFSLCVIFFFRLLFLSFANVVRPSRRFADLYL